MKSKPKFPYLKTLDFRPSAPSITKRNNIFSEGTTLSTSIIPKLNLSISVGFQDDRQRPWNSFSNGSKPLSYQFNPNNPCNWTHSVPVNTCFRFSKYNELSQLLHKQHKASIYPLNLTLDEEFYKQKGITSGQTNLIRYFSPKELPMKKNLGFVRFPSSQFKSYTFPSMSTFEVLKFPKLAHSLPPNLRLHLFKSSVNNYATLTTFLNRLSISFPHVCHSLRHVRDYTLRRHLALRLSKPETDFLYSIPLFLPDHIGDTSYCSRIQRTDITANRLYVLGTSDFKSSNYQNRSISTGLAMFSRNFISSSLDFSNDECNFFPFPDVNDPVVCSSSTPDPCVSPISQPFNLSLLQNIRMLESPKDDQLAFDSTNFVKSTDIDQSPIPLQSPLTLTYVVDNEHFTKFVQTTSPTIPILLPIRDCNLLIHDRFFCREIPNTIQACNQLHYPFPSVPHSLTSSAHSSCSNYSSTLPVSPYQDLPDTPMLEFMNFQFQVNKGDNDEILSDDAHQTSSAAEYDEVWQSSQTPCNLRLSINQCNEIVKHPTESSNPVILSKISKSLKDPLYLNGFEIENMKITENKIQLDNFMRCIHGITDSDFSSSMITLRKVIQESLLFVQNDSEEIQNTEIDPSVLIADPPHIPTMRKLMNTICQHFHNSDTSEHSTEAETATISKNGKKKIHSDISSAVNLQVYRNSAPSPSRISTNNKSLSFMRNKLVFDHKVRKVVGSQKIQEHKNCTLRKEPGNLFNITQAYTYSYYPDSNSNDMNT